MIEKSVRENTTASYRQSLKSSALIGGSSTINVFLGVVRTKALAILIGTEGIGLFGTYSTVTSLMGAIAGMGINTSGVRQIAEAVGTGDELKIQRTALILRRTSLALGMAGMLLFLFLARPLSVATFGTTSHTSAFVLLSITILFTEISAGQTALLQGLRRIRELAYLTIIGGVLGTLLSIPLVFVFREQGIVPLLVCVSALSVLSSWWYSRRIKIAPQVFPLPVIWSEAKVLLGMGVVFMSTNLMVNAVAYLTRVMIIQRLDLTAAGLYQSAYALSAVYVSFILNAMGTDYYPRLTAAAKDNAAMNRMVNEQTELALLIAIPGILITLTLGPWIIASLYSSAFAPAVDILRWQLLGILCRIITWPMGFALLAKGRAGLCFCTELLTNLVYLALLWAGMKWFSLDGLGMAFLGMYLFYGPLIFFTLRSNYGFRWNRHNAMLILQTTALTGIVFWATSGALPQILGIVFGVTATILVGIQSLLKITARSGFGNLGSAIRHLHAKLTTKFRA